MLLCIIARQDQSCPVSHNRLTKNFVSLDVLPDPKLLLNAYFQRSKVQRCKWLIYHGVIGSNLPECPIKWDRKKKLSHPSTLILLYFCKVPEPQPAPGLQLQIVCPKLCNWSPCWSNAVTNYCFISPGPGVDPWHRRVLPVHTHVHRLQHTSHTGTAKRARGLSDHSKGMCCWVFVCRCTTL